MKKKQNAYIMDKVANEPFATIDAEQGSPLYRRLPSEFKEKALEPQNFTKDEAVEIPSDGKIRPGIVYDIEIGQEELKKQHVDGGEYMNVLDKKGSYFLSKVENTKNGNNVWNKLSYTFENPEGDKMTLYTADGKNFHPDEKSPVGWVKFTELKAPTKN